MERIPCLNAAILNEYSVQGLPPEEFRWQLLSAVGGDRNAFSRFLWARPRHLRLTGKRWLRLRQSIFERDNFTCRYCGQVGGALECDHVFPASRGGSSDPENLATACFACNRAKHDKTPEEWLSPRIGV